MKRLFSRQGAALFGGLLPGLMMLLSSAPVQAATNIAQDGQSYSSALLVTGIVAFGICVLIAISTVVVGANKIVLATEAILGVVLCVLTYGQATSFITASGGQVTGLMAVTFGQIPGVQAGGNNSALSSDTITFLMN